MEWMNKHAPNGVEIAARLYAVYGPMALRYIDSDCPYTSDLIYDIDNALQMDVFDEAFVLVRAYGTNWFPSLGECIQHHQDAYCTGRVVIRIKRVTAMDFRCEIVEYLSRYYDDIGPEQ